MRWMKWWVTAILVSIVWVFLVIGISIVDIEVFFGGQTTPEQEAQIREPYGGVTLWGLVLIWPLAYSIRRWKPRVGKRSEKSLLRRARSAKRELVELALLACIVPPVLVWLANSGKLGLIALLGLGVPSVAQAVTLAAVIGILAVATWFLAVAGRRGHQGAFSIAVVVIILQLSMLVIFEGVYAFFSFGQKAPTFFWPAWVLAIVGLTNSRAVILELKERKLWEKVFAPAKPAKGYCLVGGALLVLAFLALNITSVTHRYQRHRFILDEIHLVRTFSSIVGGEEQRFMVALTNLVESDTDETYETALAEVGDLEANVHAAWEQSGEHDGFRLIFSTYGNAVRMWQKALIGAGSTDSDPSEVQAMFDLGDQLRADAMREFDRRYGHLQTT